MRARVGDTIESIVEKELEAARGAQIGDERRGYRHGHCEWTLSTSPGATTIAMPRARLNNGGKETEWQSQTVRRYERRATRVDEAILGVYLSGPNTRRIKGALSKEAVSRLMGRIKSEFKVWRERDLATEQVCYLLLDGWCPKVRIGRQRVRVPVLVTLGVCTDGRRIVLDMRLAREETTVRCGRWWNRR